MIIKDTFNEIAVGDVVSVFDDESSHDFNTHTLRVDSIEYDEEFVTEENPLGKRCYCTDLEEEILGDDYITVVHEGNYLSHLDSETQLSDYGIELLWRGFTDIPMNPKTECMEQPYFIFPEGINRMKIWDWFDKHYSKGVSALLYGGESEG